MSYFERCFEVVRYAMSQSLSWLAHIVYPTLLVCYVFFVGLKVNSDDPRILVSYISLCAYVLFLLVQLWWLNTESERKTREAEARHEAKMRETETRNDQRMRELDTCHEQNARNARYAEAMSCVHGAIHRVRDATRYLDRCIAGEVDYEVADLKDLLKPCMDSVAKAFTVVSGTSNRASIKLLDGPEEHHVVDHVRTFCRDSVSARDFFDRDKDEGHRHKVNGNTAYHEILYGHKPYFFENDLQSLGGHYHTTQYPDGKLPHRARIVLPIQYVRTDLEMRAAPSQPKILTLGFLSVNANATNVYREPYDVELGLAIADALFSVLKRAELAHDLLRRSNSIGDDRR